TTAAARLEAAFDVRSNQIMTQIGQVAGVRRGLVGVAGLVALLAALIAALYGERNRRLTEALAVRAEQEASLRKIAATLTATEDLPTALALIAEAAAATAGAEAAYIERVVEGEGRTAEVIAAVGPGAPAVGARHPYRGSMTEAATGPGGVRLVADLRTDECGEGGGGPRGRWTGGAVPCAAPGATAQRERAGRVGRAAAEAGGAGRLAGRAQTAADPGQPHIADTVARGAVPARAGGAGRGGAAHGDRGVEAADPGGGGAADAGGRDHRGGGLGARPDRQPEDGPDLARTAEPRRAHRTVPSVEGVARRWAPVHATGAAARSVPGGGQGHR